MHRRVALVLGLCIASVVIAGTAVVLDGDLRGSPLGTDPAVQPTSAAVAGREADRVLDAFHLPAGARRTPVDADAIGPIVSDQYETRRRSWVLPGTLEDVYAALRIEPQDGMAIEGEESGSDHGTVTSRTLHYGGGSLRRSQRVVVLTVSARDATTVLLTGVAQVAWAPHRPASARIPADASATIARSADLNGEHGPSQRAATAVQAAALAADVNALEADTRGVHGCLRDDGTHETVTFNKGTSISTVSINQACRSAVLQVDGKPAGAFMTSPRLTADVEAALRG